jgi:hypothetical protein
MTLIDSLAWSYLGQTLTDDFLGRRKSWTGVAVQDLHRTDEWRGHYYRVDTSWRTAPDQWWIGYECPQGYLGAEMPTGEPVYRFTGETWDMPAIPATVFPGRGTWIFYGALWVLWTLFMVFIDHDPGGVAFWKWFYTVEPVRGTKVFVVWTVIHILWMGRLRRAEAEHQAYAKASTEYYATADPWRDGPYLG